MSKKSVSYTNLARQFPLDWRRAGNNARARVFEMTTPRSWAQEQAAIEPGRGRPGTSDKETYLGPVWRPYSFGCKPQRQKLASRAMRTQGARCTVSAHPLSVCGYSKTQGFFFWPKCGTAIEGITRPGTVDGHAASRCATKLVIGIPSCLSSRGCQGCPTSDAQSSGMIHAALSKYLLPRDGNPSICVSITRDR